MNALEIIGGGLSGLGLANGLLANGVPVTVTEAGKYPRHRVCGEFLTGLNPRTLSTLGVPDCMDRALMHRNTGWYRHGRQIAMYELPEPAIGISRYLLDTRLANAFLEKGGTLRLGEYASAAEHEGRIVATGRKPGKSGMIGLKAHWRDFSTEQDLELHLGNQAYLGVSKVEDGFVNVCGIFKRIAPGKFADPVERFHETLQINGLGYLCSRLRSATYRPDSFCSITGLNYGNENTTGMGDHWRPIPPFTGHGMTIALESAELILPHAINYARGGLSWKDFQIKSQAVLRNRFNRRYLHASLFHPFILQPMFQGIAATAARLKCLPFRQIYQMTHS